MERSIYPFSIFDPWQSSLCTCPKKYSLNPYTGCSFGCLYCYAKGYIGKRESTPKKDYVKLLERSARKLNRALPVNIGTSSDPYPDIEQKFKLTRASLSILINMNFKVLITTKGGELLLRDADLMKKGKVAVTPTVTTLNEDLAKKLEPMAPSPKERIRVMEEMNKNDIPLGARVDPIIPGLNDDEKELKELVNALAEAGARLIITSTYKARFVDFKDMINVFPDMREKWKRLYFEEGERIGGYMYLSKSLRERLLKLVVDEAKKLGLEYATCREGLTSPEYFKARSCDGTHLTEMGKRSGSEQK
ncbi:SPL family radical SAM protein [Fervidicoccus fontis]|uniref:Radical SAM domain protein n=1 Tax=Fervidicoccus fontis (strain DSM 19380 / JCM 18336 / VKM B-2539 / Kam940) TaxID=1163730 RepID=I0A141_FERFK|nr:radical SAM protein [Fervidicoccus fontis]AFH42698.1 Radical SAM domain protein [Fervidicoccus fontis Kam940]